MDNVALLEKIRKINSENQEEMMEKMMEKMGTIVNEKVNEKISADQDERNKEINDIRKELGGVQQQMGKRAEEEDGNKDGNKLDAISKEEGARQAQAEVEFDEKDVYTTLVDPSTRTKEELEDYAQAAITFYTSGKINNVKKALCDDFLYWKVSHFKLVKKDTLKTMEDLLEKQGIKIRQDGRFALRKSFGQYLESVWTNLSSESMDKTEATNVMQIDHFRSRPINNKTSKTNGKSHNVVEMDTNLPWKSLELQEGDNTTTEKKRDSIECQWI